MKTLSTAAGIALTVAIVGCAPLSQPTQREQAAAIGALAGGAGGALIGSFAGSAVAGGLFGIPLGAVVGYYVGDQMANEDRIARTRREETEAEIARLRAENERLRRDTQRTAAPSPQQQGENLKRPPQAAIRSEQDITSSPQDTSGSQPSQARDQSQGTTSKPASTTAPSAMTEAQPTMLPPQELRQAQRKLNDMGFHAGPVDGVWGPNTQAAVRDFQQAKGLQATGQLNEPTLEALGLENTRRSDATRRGQQK